MKKLTIEAAEGLAYQFRAKNDLSQSEPIQLKKLLTKLNILTLYRPLSDASCGLSIKSADGRCFMLINSNIPRGRQHHTIAHELYHLFFDEKPVPHICNSTLEKRPTEEINADLFASALLMPKQGIFKMLKNPTLNNITLADVMRLENYFGVSHSSMLVRLDRLNLVTEKQLNTWKGICVKEAAQLYGFQTTLYERGNENLLIGDYRALAQQLFEGGKISEGHYWELINLLKDDSEQD